MDGPNLGLPDDENEVAVVFILFILVLIDSVAVAVASGIAISSRFRSPILATLAGGPAAVGAFYSSIFAVIVLFKDDKATLLHFDWWSLAVLLAFPAAPAFVIGAVTAGITSAVRVFRTCGLK